jgi:valyl-tRNA synthetase
MDLINGGLRPPVFKEGGSFPAYGADAVRWGLLAMASDQDVRFSEEKIAQGQQLTNKLWNASRLVLLGVGEGAQAAVTPRTIEDRWILSRLERAKAAVHALIESFDFSHAALEVYDFVFSELCDWYLELVKPRLRAGEPELVATLLYVLRETLVLAHPIIPFVTEEIYCHVPDAEGLLAARRAGPAMPVDEAAEQTMAQVIEAVTALRAWRDAAGVKVGVRVPARLAATGYEETAQHIAALGRLTLSEDGAAPVESIPVPGGAIEILASEGLDAEAAARKRAAERDRLAQEIDRAQSKLANEGFVAKAPAHVVQAEREKLERLRTELEALDVGA